MKLSRSEKRLLKFIDGQFPLPWDSANSDQVRTKEESPLPTKAGLTSAFPRLPIDQLDSALKKLQGYQCVKEVYLYAANDFSEIKLAPGISSRMPVAKAGDGVVGYQITKFGKDILAGLLSAKTKSLLAHCGKKFAEEYVPLLIAFLLGILLSSLFGFDLRDLAFIPQID